MILLKSQTNLIKFLSVIWGHFRDIILEKINLLDFYYVSSNEIRQIFLIFTEDSSAF